MERVIEDQDRLRKGNLALNEIGSIFRIVPNPFDPHQFLNRLESPAASEPAGMDMGARIMRCVHAVNTECGIRFNYFVSPIAAFDVCSASFIHPL